jgi:AAA+ ATPase superfamily predicted ATPase
MAARIIGRKEELAILEQFYNSDQPEFLAIFGRRRVGKTFLIRSYFEQKDAVFFNATGVRNETIIEQIAYFLEEVGRVFYAGAKLEVEQNWAKAFRTLTKACTAVSKDKKIVLFLDEFPWMATKNSKLLQTLDYYWNQHWTRDPRIKLIICGSSASWIINKIVKNKGGLYNRLTQTIKLEPFNLRETRNFLVSKGVKLNNKQITQLYMVMGGIPHYLARINKGLSVTQIIEQLAFKKKSFLLDEFDNLYAALFDDAETYIKLVRIIAKHRYGIGQAELFKQAENIAKGGTITRKLKDLEDTDFIISFKPYLHRRKGLYYKVIDEYTLFYFNWIEPVKESLQVRALKRGYWEGIQHSAAWHSWAGYAFEALCYKHIVQISEALDISATAIAYAWRYVPGPKSKELGAQIDLLFDRNDDVITICEIKYTDIPFKIDKQYAQNLLQKIAVFKKQTGIKKQIFLALILSSGLKKSIYAEDLISGVVALDDLFRSIT